MSRQDHLSRMYFELSQLGARCVGAKKKWPYQIKDVYQLFLLAGDLSRYDPRLLGVLVEYFIDHWQDWNPYRLRMAILKSKTPQTWGVLSAFVIECLQDNDARDYFEYVLKDIRPASPQFFFRELYPIGGKLAQKAASESLKQYLQWGFLGSERPVIHGIKRKQLGGWNLAARLNILKRLVRKKEKIAISDYLNILDHTISRQQALKDLSSCGFLRCFGKGRGAGWQLV